MIQCIFCSVECKNEAGLAQHMRIHQDILNEFKTRDKERQHLQNLANKITKVPAKINIPIEYMVDQID